MKPLSIIYWIRAGLGLFIGILCALYVYSTVSTDVTNIYTLLTGISFALLFYMATYYLIKSKYFGRVEKQSKLVTQGIGIYFFAWIVSWSLIVTLFMPSVTVNINNVDGDLGETQFQIFLYTSAGSLARQLTPNVTAGTYKTTLLPPGDYVVDVKNVTNLPEGYVIGNHNQTLGISWLQSPIMVFNVFNATQVP